MKPKLYMMIGTPYAGKSTWISKKHGVVLSTDSYIENKAKERGVSYNDIFKSVMSQAEKEMDKARVAAIKAGHDIYWDQTNLTVKSRARKLALIPDTYEKIAVIFPALSDKELERRIAMRTDKVIPLHVLKQMASTFQMPTKEEGFDSIINVG